MDQMNLEKSSDDLLPIACVGNPEDGGNSNNAIYLSDDNDKSSRQEKLITNNGGIKKKNGLNCVSENEVVVFDQTPAKSSKPQNRRYLLAWEKRPEAFYQTNTLDLSNKLCVKSVCWLYKTNDENGRERLRCKLCEKYQKTINSNGKSNPWCTSGYETIQLSKIKEHQENEVHKDAQQMEINHTAGCQPCWSKTQIKERSKHEMAIENLILTAIHVCQQDQSLNSYQRLCVLLEAVEVKLLPAEIGGISYRNDDAALEFLRHVAFCLHEQIVEKIKQSPSIGKKKLGI